MVLTEDARYPAQAVQSSTPVEYPGPAVAAPIAVPSRNDQDGVVKNSGVCPKCQGQELMRVRDDGLGVGLRVVPITRYVCFSCGFSEQWVESRADLQRLRDRIGLAQEDPAALRPGESIHDRLGLT